MFIYSTFEVEGNGRLGNQLFEIATTLGFARFCGHQAAISTWKYQSYFQLQGLTILEKDSHYRDQPVLMPGTQILVYERGERDWFRCMLKEYAFFAQSPDSVTIDLRGLFQCYQNFQHCEEELLTSVLAFRPEFKAAVLQKQPIPQKACAIHVRRTDFLEIPDHFYVLPLYYYQQAIQAMLSETDCEHFVVFSDDIEWCRENVLPLLSGQSVTFSEGLSDIEDLCAMASCDYHIIANSTYSWWGSYIGRSKHTIAPPVWVDFESLSRELLLKSLFEGRPNTVVLERELEAILHRVFMTMITTTFKPLSKSP